MFLAALAIPFTLRDWRPLGVLVTAFTVGHSLTLVLATTERVRVSSSLVEFLIPITIVTTAALALRSLWGERRVADTVTGVRVPPSRYLLTVLFGLVHGLGFSTYLRALLSDEDGLVLPLFAFNVGLELGQLLVLLAVLVAGALVVRAGVARRAWMLLLSVMTGGAAFALALQRLPDLFMS